MYQPEHLLHRELFDKIPLTGDRIAANIDQLASNIAVEPVMSNVSVAFVIRSFNEAGPLERLLEDIHSQKSTTEPQVIVVDNESDDHTADIAASFGATVRTVPRDEFTYPVSMNAGMEAVDTEVAYMTVAHALLSSRQLLNGIRRDFSGETIGGAFGRTLPNANISIPERLIAMTSVGYFPDRKPQIVSRFEPNNLGLMGATSAAFRKDLWQEYGRFDETYETGGEDTAMAKKLAADGFELLDDGLLSVHHTHGLNTSDTIKQWLRWYRTLKGPVPLDTDKLAARRRDLSCKVQYR